MERKKEIEAETKVGDIAYVIDRGVWLCVYEHMHGVA
jgi:hypothetical protein